MSATFAAAGQAGAVLDPGKHVNYTLGMVLGVDDFTQDFGYLAWHTRQAVRELIGYGVIAGLEVSIQASSLGGPQVQVTPGAAVVPSGRVVCVAPTQCADLNEWVAGHRADLDVLGSPPPSAVSLAVVACHRECLSDDVPVPGEPCRSDDELMAPSRVTDGFLLELRVAAPAQREEDAVRGFVAWARQIPLTEAPGDLDAFAAGVRAALLPAGSPLGDPLDLLLVPPPAALAIPRADAAAYLDALAGIWVQDLRRRYRAVPDGAESECACGCCDDLGEDADCVLLARLEVPLDEDALTGALVVADTPPVTVDETARPALLHLRLLQELVLSGLAGAGAGEVASGHVHPGGAVTGATGGLTATALAPDPTLFAVDFPGYAPDREYVVLGQPVAALSDTDPSTFEVIAPDDPGLPGVLGSPPAQGIVVRVRQAGGNAVPGGFTVRIERLGADA